MRNKNTSLLNKANVVNQQIGFSISGLINYAELSQILKRSENTLRRDVMSRRIPFVRIGRSIRFDLNSIHEWIQSQTVEANHENK